MPSSILFGSINVNTLDTESMVAVGENSQNSWDSPSKNVFGIGMFFGIINSQMNTAFATDNSIIGTPIIDQNFKPVGEIQG